ncbi:MAG: hypothetical protein JSS34_03360 [Proteobacteria bacterium]|nr:hypothetical protein [Pseudomonadota bacterium]
MQFLIFILTLFFLVGHAQAALINFSPEEFETWRKEAKAASQVGPFKACGAILFQLNGTDTLHTCSSATLIEPDIIIGAAHSFKYIDHGTYFFTVSPDIDPSDKASFGNPVKILFARSFAGQDVAVASLEKPITSVEPASVLTEKEYASRQSLAYAAFEGVYAGYGKDFCFLNTQTMSKEEVQRNFQSAFQVIRGVHGHPQPRIVELTPEQQTLSPDELEKQFPTIVPPKAEKKQKSLAHIHIMNFALKPEAFLGIPGISGEEAHSILPPTQSRISVSLTNTITGMAMMDKGYSAAVPGDSGAGMFVQVSGPRSSVPDMFSSPSIQERFAKVKEGVWKLTHIVAEGKLDERMSTQTSETGKWTHTVHTYAEDIHYKRGRLARAIASLRAAAPKPTAS